MRYELFGQEPDWVAGVVKLCKVFRIAVGLRSLRGIDIVRGICQSNLPDHDFEGLPNW